MKARKTDPKSSYDAAKIAEQSIKVHQAIILKALKEKPNQTAYELKSYIRQNYKPKQWLTYHQIMRRLNEVAIKGEIRTCLTGKPCCRVAEWYL